MHDTIETLLNYIQNDRMSSYTEKLESQFDKKPLRVMFLNLFGWIKRKQTLNRKKPLIQLNDIEWHNNLSTLVKENPKIERIFSIKDNKLEFNQLLSNEEQSKIIS